MSRPLLWVLGVASLLASVALWVMLQRVEPSSYTQQLPPTERRFIEFLILLPVAALLCAVVRNVVGWHTFGTFAPALLGLAFREVSSPLGVFLLLTVLSVGWVIRRGLGYLNLLQVPRAAVMLTVVVALLIAYTLMSNAQGAPVAESIPLLPMVIVTGLIERFWTAEEEDGTGTALRTMFFTLLTATAVYLVVRVPAVGRTMLDYPETLGFVLALQLLLGRYTGYRLTELSRFRELADEGRSP